MIPYLEVPEYFRKNLHYIFGICRPLPINHVCDESMVHTHTTHRAIGRKVGSNQSGGVVVDRGGVEGSWASWLVMLSGLSIQPQGWDLSQLLILKKGCLGKYHLCTVCRSAAVKFSPETVRGSCHGKRREISGEILLLLFPQETKLESAQNFSRQISRHFSRDVLQLQMPNFMAFCTLQTFVLDKYMSSVWQWGIWSTARP